MDSIKMTTEQQLQKGWKKTTLGEIATYVNGRAFKPIEWSKTGTPIVRIQNLNNPNAEYNYYDGYIEEKYHIENGDLLFAWSASLGAYIWKGKSAFLNQHIFKVLPKENVDKTFIYYLLDKVTSELYAKAHGSGMVHVTKGKFEATSVNIPSLETQQAIVNKIESLFDEIDEGIGRLKTAAQQIQQYRQSLLKNAFNGELTKEWRSKHADTLPSENELLAQIQTAREQHHARQLADWQNVTIGEVVTISPKKETAIDDNTDVSFSSMHLMSSSISEHLTYEIKKWADVKKGFTVFRNNDVLLAKITPCFENGKSAVAQDLINGIGTGSTEFMVLRCSSQLLPKFLYFLVNTPDFRQAGIHNMTGSVGHKRVPKDFVSSWTFSLPSLTEQTQIVAILETKLTACDQLAAELAKQLKQAELLKQAVLKAAFSGSLLDK
jgi:type-1 restriction enzyme stySJI specificity protein